MDAMSPIALGDRTVSRCIVCRCFHMQRLVDNFTCNQNTWLSWRSSCVVFVCLSCSLEDA